MKMRLLTVLTIACLMSGAMLFAMRPAKPVVAQQKATKQQWNNLISAVTHFRKGSEADNRRIKQEVYALLDSGETAESIVKWLKARRPKVSADAIKFVQDFCALLEETPGEPFYTGRLGTPEAAPAPAAEGQQQGSAAALQELLQRLGISGAGQSERPEAAPAPGAGGQGEQQNPYDGPQPYGQSE